jgi:hypothetical protein
MFLKLTKKRNSLIDILKSFRINITLDIYKKEEEKEEQKFLFKNRDVFAYMFNNNIEFFELNVDLETIKFTFKNGAESFVIHQLSTNEIHRLSATIKDLCYMDISVRRVE